MEHGALWLELAEPAGIRLANVHLRIGADEQHLVAVEHLLRVAGRNAVLLGDFNCGHSVRSGAYRRILDEGFADAYLAAGRCEAPTWDAANPYNQVGRFRRDPSQRIDHVFAPQQLGLIAGRAEIVLDGEHPLSDHYGLLVSLELPDRTA